MPDLPEEAVEAAKAGIGPGFWIEDDARMRKALEAAAPAIRKQERERIAKSFEYRDGEDPVGLQEAQASLEGLYGGADLHDPNCGLPEPGDDGHDRGCTCGVAAIHERFSEAIALALDQARKQRDEELRERVEDYFRYRHQDREELLRVLFEEADRE